MTTKELTIKLRTLAEYTSKASEIESEICEYSIEKYGCTPNDVDNDEYIDSCLIGSCKGMTAKEFHRSMKECLEHEGGNG